MSLPILSLKDENGNWISVPAIVGPKGSDGTPGEQGPQGEPGPKGDKGDSGIPALNLVEVAEGVANVTMLPNRLYLTQTPCTQITVALEPIQELIYAEYMLCFVTDSACVLTMPESIMWDGGEAPTLEANKYYELSVLNNVAVISRGASL